MIRPSPDQGLVNVLTTHSYQNFTMIKDIAKNVSYGTRHIVGSYQALSWLLRFSKFAPRLVRPSTNICIEGFPRSANSFFCIYFMHFNPGLRIAHHVHVPQQAALATKFGIPCLQLIRPPVDTLLSLLAIDQRLSPVLALRSYIDYYRRMRSVAGYCIVSDFSFTIQTPEQVVDALNERFGSGFLGQPIDEKLRVALFERVRRVNDDYVPMQVAIPTTEKDEIKQTLRHKIEGSPLIEGAEKAYRSILARDGTLKRDIV